MLTRKEKIKRFLRWFKPFHFEQEGFHNGILVLSVWRFGRHCWEVWAFDDLDDPDFYCRLVKKQAKKSELYNRIKACAVLVMRTPFWALARGYC